MKIIHLADTHLGYSAYRKTNEEGINQREIDVYNAFSQCIDYAVRTKPDAVLHAGDLFDTVRPTNRAITVALQQILRLSKEHIPFVIISGNHETPRMKETGNIFKIFEHLEHVYPVCNNRYETITLPNKEDLTIHAIPHCQSPKEFEQNIQQISIDKNTPMNILLAHGAVTGIKEFKMNEFNELFIPIKTLHKEFDYIALGHYHLHTKLQENTFYAGSTEHFTFTEANTQKGFLEITLGTTMSHRFIPLQVRPMIDTQPLNCLSLSSEKILQNVKDILQALEPKDKIIRLRLENIPSHIQKGINLHQLQDYGKTALHFELKFSPLKTEEEAVRDDHQMKSLAEEYELFLKTQDYTEKEMLLKRGLEYIHKVEEQDETP